MRACSLENEPECWQAHFRADDVEFKRAKADEHQWQANEDVVHGTAQRSIDNQGDVD